MNLLGSRLVLCVAAHAHLRKMLGVSRLMVGIVCRTCSTIQLFEALTLRTLHPLKYPPPHMVGYAGVLVLSLIVSCR